MKHPPKYSRFGSVTETKEQCFCKQNRGTVWWWVPPIQGYTKEMGMPAHTKCFRRLWA